jgi:hypothetical protein
MCTSILEFSKFQDIFLFAKMMISGLIGPNKLVYALKMAIKWLNKLYFLYFKYVLYHRSSPDHSGATIRGVSNLPILHALGKSNSQNIGVSYMAAELHYSCHLAIWYLSFPAKWLYDECCLEDNLLFYFLPYMAFAADSSIIWNSWRFYA